MSNRSSTGTKSQAGTWVRRAEGAGVLYWRGKATEARDKWMKETTTVIINNLREIVFNVNKLEITSSKGLSMQIYGMADDQEPYEGAERSIALARPRSQLAVRVSRNSAKGGSSGRRWMAARRYLKLRSASVLSRTASQICSVRDIRRSLSRYARRSRAMKSAHVGSR